MEAITVILMRLLIGLMIGFCISRFVDWDLEMTDKHDGRWNLETIKSDPIATATYASSVQRSKRLFYTVLFGIIIFVSFL